RTRGALGRSRAGLRAGHHLPARLVVKEDEAAVDERPEPGRPADADFVFANLVARREPHLREVVLRGHRKEMALACEVDDLAMVGGGLLGHAPAIAEAF